jgi:hypothetical protein
MSAVRCGSWTVSRVSAAGAPEHRGPTSTPTESLTTATRRVSIMSVHGMELTRVHQHGSTPDRNYGE